MVAEMLQNCGIDAFDALLERLLRLEASDDELEELGVGHNRWLYLERSAAKRTVEYWIRRIERGAGPHHGRYLRYVNGLTDEYGFRLDEFGVTLDYLQACHAHTSMPRFVVAPCHGYVSATRIRGSTVYGAHRSRNTHIPFRGRGESVAR